MNVVKLMFARRKSLNDVGKRAAASERAEAEEGFLWPAAEMLMAISSKDEGKREAKTKDGAVKETKQPARHRKAG